MSPFDLNEMLESLGPGAPAFQAEETLIIALDFGTTFSGISYCFPNQHNSRVATVVNWPGKRLTSNFNSTSVNSILC